MSENYYVVSNTSQTLVADAIREAKNIDTTLSYPQGWADAIAGLKLKRGVLRPDAELIHTVSRNQTIEKATIGSYATTSRTLVSSESSSPITIEY